MNETRDLLERVGGRFAFPANALERLEPRRDRKRRNRRIAAGIAGIAIFAALVFGLARATLSESSPTPAVPDQSPSPSIQTEQLPQILRRGEVVVVGDNSSLEALDRSNGERRTLAQCEDPCVSSIATGSRRMAGGSPTRSGPASVPSRVNRRPASGSWTRSENGRS